MTLLFIGTGELLLIVLLALLLFGGKKLPEMMKGLGKGVKSFKEGLNEMNPMQEQQSQQPTVAATNATAVDATTIDTTAQPMQAQQPQAAEGEAVASPVQQPMSTEQA